jgi:hypothetical protein
LKEHLNEIKKITRESKKDLSGKYIAKQKVD